MDHARVVAGMDSEREGYYMVPRTSVDVGLKPKSHAQIKMIADEVRASIPEYVWAKKQLDRARELWHDPQKLPHACSYTFLECLVWLWGEVLLHSVPLLKRELEKQYKLQPAYLSQGVFGSAAWQRWEQCFWLQYVHYQDLDRQNIGKAVTLQVLTIRTLQWYVLTNLQLICILPGILSRRVLDTKVYGFHHG